MVTNKLTWGDSVVVKENAPKKYNPCATGSVCGVRTVENLEESQEFCCSVGDNLCLVEFSDGCSIEIPDVFLSPKFYV